MRRLLLLLAAVGVVALLVMLATGAFRDCSGAPPEDDAERRVFVVEAEVPLAQDPGRGRISGTVWRGGRPVAARVDLFPLPGAGEDEDLLSSLRGSELPERSHVTGDTGRFHFRGLAAGRYEVRAVGDGARGSVVTAIRLPGERVVADVTLPDGPHVLHGRAVYEDGRPFPGRLSVVTQQPSAHIAASVPDAEGRFTVSGLVEGLVRVVCVKPGELRYADRWVRIPHESELLVVVDRGTAPLAGRILSEEDGSPIAGAVVIVSGDTGENRERLVRTVTDETGRFRVRTFPARRDLLVRAEGFSPVERWVPREVQEVEIRLGRTATVSGRVLAAEDRRPLAGIPVRWETVGTPHRSGRTASGPDGRYAFDGVSNGEIAFLAQGGGWISRDALPALRILASGADERVDLLVVRAVRLRGRVVDDRGEGLPGILVVVDGGSGWTDRLERVTDAEGSFELASLAPGLPYRVIARPPDRGPVTGPSVVGASGETVEITLEVPSADTPPRWLDVSVVERDSGAPVVGARVSTGGLGGRTGADGRCRLGPLPGGVLSVWVHHPDHLLLKKRPVVEEESGLIPVTVRLRRGLSIAGTVLLPDGRPLENGTVWVKAVSNEAAGPDSSTIGEVTAGGEFRAGGLVAGAYRIKIGGTHESGGYWANATVKAGREDLVLTTEEYVGEEKGELHLRVLDPDGNPVPAAVAFLRFEGDDDSWSDTLEVREGRATFEFWGLEGRVTFVVGGARTESGAPLPYGATIVGPFALENGEREIRLPAERTIEGIVRDTGGRPVAGALLRADPGYSEDFEDLPRAEAQSDDRGSFRLTGLGEGEHRVHLSAGRRFLPVEPRTVRPGTSGIEFVLVRGAPVRVTVLDAGGSPVAGAEVGASEAREDDDERVFFAITRRDGTSVLDGLDPERTSTLSVEPPHGAPLLPWLRDDWRPADVTVTLPEGRYVSGVVHGPDRRPVSGVMVHARPEGDPWNAERVDGAGRFRFGPYRPGSVDLVARRAEMPFPAEDVVRVEAGRQDVVLTCEAGRTLSVRIEDWNEDYGPAMGRLSGGGPRKFAPIERDGTCVFTGLLPEATVTVWAGPFGDGLYLLRRDLRPDVTELSARLMVGGAVTGRLILPPGAEEVAVRVDGAGYSPAGVVEPDGSFAVSGVPPGECVVTATARVGRHRFQGHRWTRAGETVVIELTER